MELQTLRVSVVAALCLVGLGVVAEGRAASPDFKTEVRPILERHCFDCHGSKATKAGIDLARFTDETFADQDPDLWVRVSDAISERTMPPKGKPEPTESERTKVTDAIRLMLDAFEGVRDPGRRTIQRLTREQYNNSVYELLGIDTRPADAFPADGGGGGGFDNNGSTLFVPPILMEKYLNSAVAMLEQADPSKYVTIRPGEEISKEEAARRCLGQFASRAYRRPVPAEELDRLYGLFQHADDQGRPFDEALRLALQAVLVSPHFLFLVETDQESKEPYRIGEYELASRLSYFLWTSMPDEVLLDLARRGTLHEPEVLEQQVRRMLADGRSRNLAKDFAGQWLQLKALANFAEPDRSRYREYTPELRDAMVEEAITSFHALFRDDAPLLDLVVADFVYVNEVLAKHYGMEGVSGPEFRKVSITDQNRGGVLGMAAVLTMTSYPERTSPVLRGKWILTELLGTPPSPPPSNVKILPLDDKLEKGLTFRGRLEQHRNQPACAACHAKLDPPGFGLEGFDPIGRIRAQIGGGPVDDSGELTSGETFRGAAELKRILKERKKDVFVRNITRRMLSYALARGLEPYDAPTVREIIAALQAKGYRSSVLITEIVRSFPFQYRRNEPIARGKS